MTSRILTWHLPTITGDGTSQGPAYYIEHDYEPVAVRIYARVAPTDGDVQVDIKDDGSSIFSGYAVLSAGDNLEEAAEDFLPNLGPMETGSIVTLDMVRTGGAADFTIQMELETIDEDDEDEV